jgi:hypothetical protein
MKNLLLGSLLGLALSSQSACGGARTADASAPVADATTCQPLQNGKPGASRPLASLDGRIESDCLVLDLRYSGGCATHAFQLHWDGSVMESMPPQVRLHLSHQDGGDHCERMVQQTLRFDLSTLKFFAGQGMEVGIASDGLPGIGLRYQP